MKKIFYLNGLDCANCAATIESELNNHKQVKANLDFLKSTIEVESSLSSERISELVKDTVIRHESHVQVTEKEEEVSFHFPWKTALIGVLFYLLGYFVHVGLYYPGYLFFAGHTLYEAWDRIGHKDFFNETILMSVATLGAMYLGEYLEVAVVMLFWALGESFEHLAVNRSRRRIKEAMSVHKDKAYMKTEEGRAEVSIHRLLPGDIISVYPGEKILLDGIVVQGESYADTSFMTGESYPRRLEKGKEVLSGFVNLESPLDIQVTHPYEESSMARILKLVEESSTHKAQAEKLITRFSAVYTPIVFLIALCLYLIPTYVMGQASSVWLYRSLIFLVVSCPCALVISVPLSYFSGIGLASKNAVLFKGANYMEALEKVKTVAFDKTGTLTKGSFEILQVIGEKTLYYAKSLEQFSSHPLAQVLQKTKGDLSKNASLKKEESGFGLVGTVDEKNVLVGNRKLLEKNKVSLHSNLSDTTTVYVAVEGVYCGEIHFTDKIKEESSKVVEFLRKNLHLELLLLSGDMEQAVEKTAKELQINSYKANLLPEDKVHVLLERKESIAFVGDGTNDAPALSAATVGISMAALSTDAALEASDLVLLNGNLSDLPKAFLIAKKTRRTAIENIVFALSIKVLILILAALGFANMWLAILADVGVSLIAILHSVNLLRYKLP